MLELHRLDVRNKALAFVGLAEGGNDRERFHRIREALKDAGAVVSTSRGLAAGSAPETRSSRRGGAYPAPGPRPPPRSSTASMSP